MADEKGQCDLARGRGVGGGDFRQEPAPGGVWARKAPMAEGAVGGDGDAAPLAPRQHGVFDGALFEMIEDLIAGEAPFPLPRDRKGLFEVARIEIADAPGQSLALAPQLLEPRDRIREPVRTAPMQEIAIDPVGPQTAEGALASRNRPSRRGVMRENLGHQKDFLASPGDRLADQLLCCARAVHLRRIDMGHAEIETAAHGCDRGGAVALLEIPRSLANDGNVATR